MIIGKFTKNDKGIINGKLETLTFVADITFYPNTGKKSEKEPDYRIYRGKGEVGGAWDEHHDNCGSYLSLRLDAPTLAAPLYAALFTNEDGSYRMVWNREKQND